MKIRWLVIAGAVLGFVAAEPALAAPKKSRAKATVATQCVDQPFQFSWDRLLSGPEPQANGCAPAVYDKGRYVGQDPDPFIRLQLQRMPWTGYTVDMQ